VDIGVVGFRIDAAKHMWPGDIEATIAKVGSLPEGDRLKGQSHKNDNFLNYENLLNYQPILKIFFTLLSFTSIASTILTSYSLPNGRMYISYVAYCMSIGVLIRGLQRDVVYIGVGGGELRTLSQ
jgi:hypothetical protein